MKKKPNTKKKRKNKKKINGNFENDEKRENNLIFSKEEK